MLSLRKRMIFRSEDGAELILEPVDIKGGNAFLLTLRCGGGGGGGGTVTRICGCNGVYRECPEGMSPMCDCTTDPPRLTCVPTGRVSTPKEPAPVRK